MPGEDLPGESGDERPPDRPGDEDASGLPPHPLDRAWFHPSELKGYMAPADAPPRRWDWTVIAMAAAAGAILTFVVLAATGALGGGGSSPAQSVVIPAVRGLDDSVHRVVTLGSASVVAVVLAPADGSPSVKGSGVVVGTNRVLTAASLVGTAGTISVTTTNGRLAQGTLAGVDPETDLAVVRVPRGKLPVARFGSTSGLEIGQPIVTLGAAGGDHRWTDDGVIAALDRVVARDDGGMLAGLIETDVEIADTAAGGALLDDGARVVGILSGAAPGRAVPIDVARDVAAQLASSGRARHGWLGLATTDATDREGGGARVETVAPGSPAEQAGLDEGDVVTSIGPERVTDTPDLLAAVLRRKPGDPVAIVAWRGDHKVRKQVSLGERAPAPGTMGSP